MRATMKAIELQQTGGPEVMRLVDLPTPRPGVGQVLIQVTAAGINFAETMMRQGTYPTFSPLPLVLGSEVAGTIVAVGEGTDASLLGSRVASLLPTFTGGYAEFAVTDAQAAIPLPENVADAAALAVLVQGLTAYFLLDQAAPPQEGQSLLVHAAAGGVGSLLLQLARRRGNVTVIGAASSDAKLRLIRSLGADAAINYIETDWVESLQAATQGKGPDIVYQSVGGTIGEQSFAALAPFGRLVVYGAMDAQASQLTASQVMQLIYQNQAFLGFALPALFAAQPARVGSALQELLGLLANGQLKAIVSDVYPLADAALAHRAIEERRTSGKVVLTVG